MAHNRVRYCRTSSGRIANQAWISCSAPPRTTTHLQQQEWPQSKTSLRFLLDVLDRHELNIELRWERLGQFNTRSALPVTHCKRTGMMAYCIGQGEIAILNGWLTEHRTWCVYTWERFIHVDACLSAIPVHNWQWRMSWANIITSWLQAWP